MSPATGQPSRTALARRLRKNSTDAERALWRQLRAARLNGHKFRRQVPIGWYVVDFVCFETRLVVEVDGGQHAEQQRRDAQRTVWLEAQGFRVLRFWNNEVLGNMEGVKEVIARACAGESPSPRPPDQVRGRLSPTRGEGETLAKSPPPVAGEGETLARSPRPVAGEG